MATKFYETHFDEYVRSVKMFNLHADLLPLYAALLSPPCSFFSPASPSVAGAAVGSSSSSSSSSSSPSGGGGGGGGGRIKNLFFYGPAGIGKYSQLLLFLSHVSPSELKYEKRVSVTNINDKDAQFTYLMSDVHFEIDMSLLGCNAKLLWHEIYTQIVDIVSMSQEKKGVVVCKNFHATSPDLLAIFHSYVDSVQNHIHLSYIFLTEHLSFIPSKITKNAYVINLPRPTPEAYTELFSRMKMLDHDDDPGSSSSSSSSSSSRSTFARDFLREMQPSDILNIKELRCLKHVRRGGAGAGAGAGAELPRDAFNVVCDEVIEEMRAHEKLDILLLRDRLYDILVYQLDVAECIWYTLESFLENPAWWTHRHASAPAARQAASRVVQRVFPFLKHYNNNYRPIYHLESIFVNMIIEFYGMQ